MRGKWLKRIVAFCACSLMALTAVGCDCGGGQKSVIYTVDGLEAVVKTGTGLKFGSSDASFDTFINDYYSRHVRDNSTKSIGNVQLGLGRMYQKAGEAKSIAFYNSTSEGVYGYSPTYNLGSELDAYYVTQYGNVMDYPYVPIEDGRSLDYNMTGGLGWPFVTGWRTGNYSDEFIADTTDWTINGESNKGNLSKGYLSYTFNGAKDQSLVYQVTDIDAPLEYAPLIEISLGIKNVALNGGLETDIEDIYVSWQMDGEWYAMSYYRDAMYNKPITGYGTLRAWFPAYLHPSWDKTKSVTGFKMEIVPKAGKSLDISVDYNYFRLQTDTRLTNNNSWYIIAMEEFISFTGDFTMLERHLDDLRRAIMFSIYALKGETGLLYNDYIWGKSTTFVEKGKFGLQGNGWFDCVPTGNLNTEANIEFYHSLNSMATLEELAAAKGITADTKIRNPHPFDENANDIEWSYTPQSLRALANTVKNNMRKNVADGGLWNPVTGRFAWAVYDDNYDDGTGILYEGGRKGEAFDYGFTQINLDAVLSGIATEEQAESIMSWINGTRIVATDDACGEDIYLFEFAPRVSTRNRKVKDEISVVSSWKFGTDVQNGGASMHVSYYDLIARNTYGGADCSFERFKNIQKWYEKVMAVGGTGYDFYRAYYIRKQIEGDGEYFTMAGGGTLGAIGLDFEFYESSMLYATIPTMYFGLDSTAYKELTIEPNIPSSLSYMLMENLRFYDIVYDLYVSNNKVIISGFKGDTGLKAKITLKTDGKSVFVNNQKVDGTELNGKTTVTIDFTHSVIEVK